MLKNIFTSKIFIIIATITTIGTVSIVSYTVINKNNNQETQIASSNVEEKQEDISNQAEMEMKITEMQNEINLLRESNNKLESQIKNSNTISYNNTTIQNNTQKKVSENISKTENKIENKTKNNEVKEESIKEQSIEPIKTREGTITVKMQKLSEVEKFLKEIKEAELIIKLDAVTVYKNKIDVSNNDIVVKVDGTGKKKVSVYVDGGLIRHKYMDFNDGNPSIIIE